MFNHYQLLRYASTEVYLDKHPDYLEEDLYGKRYRVEQIIEAKHGLYALVIKDIMDQTHALVFRGSDTKGIRFLKNWFQTNIPNAIGSPMSSKMSEPVFYESMLLYESLTKGNIYQGDKEQYNENKQVFTITHVSGNSLGGTHAMLLGAIHSNIEAITINPGPIVKTLRPMLGENKVFDNITNYITEHDSLYRGVQLTNRFEDIVGEKIIVAQTPIKVNDLIYRHRGCDVDLMIYRYVDHDAVVKATNYFIERKANYHYSEYELLLVEKQKQMVTQLQSMQETVKNYLSEINQSQELLLDSLEKFMEQLLSTLLTTKVEQTLILKKLFRHRFNHLFKLYHSNGHHYKLMLTILSKREIGFDSLVDPVAFDEVAAKHDIKGLEEGIILLIDEMITHYTNKSFTHVVPYLVKLEMQQFHPLIEKIVCFQPLVKQFKDMLTLHNASYHLMMIVLLKQGDIKTIEHIKRIIKQGEENERP